MDGVQIGTQRNIAPDGSGESWDKVEGYFRYGPGGVVLEQRALTAEELAWLVAMEQAADREVREVDLHQQARTALVNNADFLNLPAPTYPLNAVAQQRLVEQVQALTRQVNGIIRLLLGSDLLDP